MNFNLLQKPPPDDDKKGWYRWFYRVCELLNRPAHIIATTSTTATVGTYLDCDCTSGIITVTLPTGTNGDQINIRKTDATVNKVVITGVGDIAFQGTSIHLYNVSGTWRPS
jgi:hypothetical protein